MTNVSQRWLVAVAAIGAAMAAGAVILVVLSPDPRPQGRLTPPTPVPRSSALSSAGPASIAFATGPYSSGPVAPPASGAYLGAWVRPASLTQPGRLAAVTEWEATLGRRLDIVNTYRRFDEEFFTESDREFTARGSTLMLSWAGGDTRMITMGRHDALIRERAEQVKAFGKPVLLRFRWEMDRPGLRASMWSPADYIAAWKHVRKLFAAVGATNASWVWCPTVEGFESDAPDFYPGDDQTDWVCADVYAGVKFSTLENLVRPFLQWAAAHPKKPIMIGEFGVAQAWGARQRARWLREAAAVFKANPQIRAVVYFESDPTDAKGANQHFQISDDPVALEAFRELAREPYFNPASR
jgi:hypothetical protein